MVFGVGQLKNLANKGGDNTGRSQSKHGRNLKIHTQNISAKQTITSPKYDQIPQIQVPR
jgi:hypothetical protein